MSSIIARPNWFLVLKRDGEFIKDHRLVIIDGAGQPSNLLALAVKYGIATRDAVKKGHVQVARVTLEVAETIATRK